MSDPGKVLVAIAFFASVAYSISAIVRAWGMRQHFSRSAGDLTGSTADARLSRLEQAVDAIALEIERISEGQRFTTKLLSEQARHANSAVRELSSHTPT